LVTPTLQPRSIILLEDDTVKEVQLLNELLESPLGLARDLVELGFEFNASDGLLSKKEKLDKIKLMTAGLASAERKSSYPIANYAVYLFSFQQFFHSSYRARQGNVLEAVVRQVLQESKVTAFKRKEHKSVMKDKLGVSTKKGHDLDVLATDGSSYLIVQIRSRDDTGGTTAKGSLVELLRDILREKHVAKYPILYVIFVWEELEGNQEQSLIDKVLAVLGDEISGENLEEKLHAGETIQVNPKIKLQLAYGQEKFTGILTKFTGNPGLNEILKKKIQFASSWDDLWLAYAMSSLELERLALGKRSNFQILDEKLRTLNIKPDKADFPQYLSFSDKLAHKLADDWKDDLPVSSVSDQIIYIRDLILLWMIHKKHLQGGLSLKKTKGQASLKTVWDHG
jgi:hypothetical protein